MDAIGLYNRVSYAGSSLPMVGDMFRAVDSYNYMSDYMKNTPEVSWETMKYPSLKQGSGNIGRAGMTLSRNILSLYR